MCSSYHKRIEKQKKISKKRENKRLCRIRRLRKLKELEQDILSIQINHKAILS